MTRLFFGFALMGLFALPQAGISQVHGIPLLGDAAASHLSGNPAWAATGTSVSFLGIGGDYGLDPYVFRNLGRFGETLDDSDKARILADVQQQGGVSLGAHGEVNLFTLVTRGFGLQVGGVFGAEGHIPEDVVELALYGNVGQSGNETLFLLDGFSGNGSGGLRVGGSYAHAFGSRPVVLGARMNRFVTAHSLHIEDMGSRLDRSGPGPNGEDGRIDLGLVEASGWGEWTGDLGVIFEWRGATIEAGMQSLLRTAPSGSLGDLEMEWTTTLLGGDAPDEDRRISGLEASAAEVEWATARVRSLAPERRVKVASHWNSGAHSVRVGLEAGEEDRLLNRGSVSAHGEYFIRHVGIRPGISVGTRTSSLDFGLAARIGSGQILLGSRKFAGERPGGALHLGVSLGR